MNGERRIQRVRAAIRPVGESKPDWQIVAELARTMGHRGFAFDGPEDIWNEVRKLCEGARGMTYERLDRAGLQWPCPAVDHPGTSILHLDRFGDSESATLQRLDYRPSPESTTAQFPYLLITGRSLYQFNASTMTGRTLNNRLRPSDVLDIGSDDAKEVGVRDGDRARVTSAYGTTVLPVRINDAVARGQVFATFHTTEFLVNAVTSSNGDSMTGTPEYKVTAVRVEPESAGLPVSDRG